MLKRLWNRIQHHAARPYWPCLLGALVLLLTSPALFGGLVNDDLMQRLILRGDPAVADVYTSPFEMFDFADGDPERTQRRIERGHLPWWTLPELKYRFLRPVAVLTHMLDYALWPSSPALMHLQSMGWGAACVVLVAWWYRRLLPSLLVAGIAALLFAIDDSHAVPVASICNRNSLIGLFFGVLLLICHDRWRREGRWWGLPVACVALGLGLLANEGVIAVGGYLLGYALFVDPARWRRGFMAIVPYGVIVAVWHTAYGKLGYGAYGSLSHTDPGAFPMTFSTNLPGYASALFLGQWIAWPAELYLVYPPVIVVILVLVALALAAFLGRVLWPRLREEPALRMCALGMVLAIIPACTTLPDDRSLLFIGLGAMPLAATLILGWKSFAGWRMGRIVIGGLVVCHLILAPLLLPVRVALVDMVGGLINDAVHAMPLAEENLEEQTVVVVNAPAMGFAPNISIIRLGEGKPAPARVRDLGPNFPPEPLTLERRDKHTLVVTRPSGFPHLFFRGQPAFQYRAGDVVAMSDVEITIVSITERGLPQRVAYRFNVPLGDASLQWVAFNGKKFVPYQPPDVGEEAVQ